ncbi:MAG: response regulator [Bacteroides sp.]|nr:response regulator [Prevotella sp.]MCM1408170.1 response regulator [Treponema brennaborense]MCM1469494.1 response regulator [Bacteroides sp.]
MKKLPSVFRLCCFTAVMCVCCVPQQAFAQEQIQTAAAAVRVGYYDSGEPDFQSGFSDDVRKSGYAYDYYQMLARFAGWKYEYVYGSREEIREKLAAGEIDIMAGAYKTNGLFADKVDFSAMDMGLNDGRYFAVSKANAGLLGELNYAMAQIAEVFPTFTFKLYQKHFNKSSFSGLTEREEQWLLQKNTLTFGYTRHHLPFSGQDDEGNPAGLAGELIRQLEEFADIKVVPVCFDYVWDMENALKDHTIDIGFPMYSDSWIAERKGLIQTETVVTDRMMMVYRGEYTRDTTSSLAMPKMSLGLRDYLPTNYPNSAVTEYDNFKDTFDAVYYGKVGAFIAYSSIIQRQLTGYDKANELKVSYLDKTEELCMLVCQHNAVLAVILDKMINQINREVIMAALLRHASMKKDDPTLLDFFKRYAHLFVIVLVVFVSCIAAAFAMYIRKSRAYAREQEEMQSSLKKALEMADAANKAKTQFLSSMSHDIRTPMNAIVGMTDIAKKHTDDKEKLEDCLDKITLSSHHLLTLINDVLDISKIESGRLTLNPINFSLRSTTDNLVNIVRPMIKSKRQEFEVRIHNVNCETLYGDELRVSQIFINILSNAVKYTPDGGKIILDLHEEFVDEQTVRLTYIVKDNGIGMSREYMEKMYDTFTRANDSRINKVQGTGLGLAIVRQMVMLMDGTIECESEVDKGTTFTVKLELPVGEEKRKVYTLPPIDILFVDDDEVFLTITEDTVEEMGANVETAATGEKALELVKKRHEEGRDYSIAIVDWRLPGMSGAETVRAIREIAGEDTSIILVSAYDWSDIEEDAKTSGADGFISKPLFKSYLAEKIELVISKGEAKTAMPEDKNGDLKGLHVLVAEDNDINWEIISELLEMQGITADHAENGKEALSAMENAEDGKYSLILMDVQMPLMNGREATAELRKSPRGYVKNIPIIAMTADAFAEDIAACLAAGMDGHVPKPVDMDKLFQEMRRVLTPPRRPRRTNKGAAEMERP